jgi:predicted metal-dependent phosphoesterase TrpH
MYSKADTHIHTTFSDGLMSPEEVVDFGATQTDLRVIAITDHDTAEGALLARQYAQRYAGRLEVIVGQEVSTKEGDVVGLFLQTTLPKFKTAAAAIEAIHVQGGLAVAVHPFAHWFLFGHMKGVSRKILSLPFDGVEIRNGFPTNLISSNPLTTWLNRIQGQRLPALGGSDSHVSFTIGQPGTRFPGSTAADFRRAVETNQVQAKGLCWSLSSIARLIPTLARQGLPSQQQKRSEAELMHVL